MPATLVSNRPLMRTVLRRFATMYLEHLPPFDNLTPPEQKHLPEAIVPGSIEHADYIGFAGWMQRNGMDGELLAMNAGSLWRDTPWVVNPRLPESQDRERFDFLYRFMPYASKDNRYMPVQRWFDTLGKVRANYDGDWRNIFLTLPQNGNVMHDRELLIDRLDDFPGVGHKIAQLIIQWIQEADWKTDLDKWERIRRVPAVAVDLWIMRLVWQFQLYTDYSSETHTAISRPISDELCQVCHEEGIEHHAVGQALWHIGAVICRNRPRKSYELMRRYCKAHCPAYSICKGVVPANYSRERFLSGSASGRLASMRWSEMAWHNDEGVDLSALTDLPGFEINQFVPKKRDFGSYRIAQKRAEVRAKAAKTQLTLDIDDEESAISGQLTLEMKEGDLQT